MCETLGSICIYDPYSPASHTLQEATPADSAWLLPVSDPCVATAGMCSECSSPESVKAVSQQPLQGRRQDSMLSQYNPLNHPCKQATRRELHLRQGRLLLGLKSQSPKTTMGPRDHGSQVNPWPRVTSQEGWSLQTSLFQQD